MDSKEVPERNPAIISQRIIPGVLAPQNEQAFDWGWQGLIALGNRQIVVIIDPYTLQVVQTLVKHRNPVSKVKWARENYHHDAASPYSLRVASVDVGGHVVVWDVAQGSVRTEFFESGRTVNDLEWLSCQDASHDLLVAIHSPNLLVLWNADTGTKLWKKFYDNIPNLRSIATDPFEPTRFAALGADCILFVNDFSISRQPASDGKKFYMSVDKPQKNVTPTRVNLTAMGRAAISGIRLLIGDEKLKGTELSLSECRHLVYLPSMRHHLAIVFPSEILVMDVSILQAVASIPLERNGSPFMKILPVRQRASFICAHENGSLSFRIRRSCRLSERGLTDEDDAAESSASKYDLNFDTACHSEPFRVTNRVRPVSAALCPVTEHQAAVLVSDGRIFIWKISSALKEKSTNGSAIHPPRCFSITNPKNHTLTGILAPTQNILPAPEEKNIDKVWGDPVSLKFLMVGLFSSLTCQVTCIRMCPPLTNKNWPHYYPLMAVGLLSGNILIFDLGIGKLLQEFSVHTCEVRGIEWTSLRSFVSFAYPQSNSQGSNASVINEVLATDIQSGRTVPFRADKNTESPVSMIKVSSKRQYLLIVFHEKPVELWDVKTRSLLRVLPTSFPQIQAVEWAPTSALRKIPNTSESESTYYQEHLVFTDASSTLYHCIAEGSSFKQGSRIPHVTERNSTITCITWKQDHILMGDTDGMVNIWNLKTRLARGIPTHRGWIKKVRFGPGKGNMMVLMLFEDGIEIWDGDDGAAISSVKTPKHLPKAIDVDWCGSDKVVLACENGQMLVMDFQLPLPPVNLPTTEQLFWKAVSCPYLLPTKPALLMKAMLQHGKLHVEKLGEKLDYSKTVQDAINALPGRIYTFLSESDNTLARCAAVARIFGDESEVHLWNMLSHYVSSTEPMATDTDLDTLCDCEIFKLNELQRSLRHGMLRNTPQQTKKCIENLVLFGQVDKAIRLSLETEPNSKSYYEDCLKSCLLATLQTNPEASQSSVKLIATNLIANGKLQEGVELLCMIDKCLDACRYLASHGHWELAVWLAKIRLTGSEYEEIMIRWANHLCSPRVNNKSKAILVYISLRKFSRVIETFHQMRHFDRAVMFAQICQDLNILEDDPKLKSLLESVHSEYARFLQGLGCEGELVKTHLSQVGNGQKSEVSEAGSDDTNSSESSGVMIPSPSSNSDEFEKVG